MGVNNILESCGVEIIEGFLPKGALESLNRELDLLFSTPSMNGSLFSISIRKGYKSIMMPAIAVREVNLFELALQVRDALASRSDVFNRGHPKLTALNIESEEANPGGLFWHTDFRSGMMRGILYLRGGKANSGTFRYMIGTQIRDYEGDHFLTAEQVKDMSSKIQDCIAPEGSLILFDSFGFHSKKPCIEERRIIMFEFQPDGLPYPKSGVPFSARNLSRRVLDNIEVFANGAVDFNHSNDIYYRAPPPVPKGRVNVLLRRVGKNVLRRVGLLRHRGVW